MKDETAKKPLGEFTDEEREELRREIEERIPQEERELLARFFEATAHIGEWYSQPGKKDMREHIRGIFEAVHEVIPALHDEVMKIDPNAGDMTLEEALESGLLDRAFENMAARLDAPSVAIEPIKSADFPLDKVNATVWKLLEETKEGQLAFNIGVENETDKQAGKEINIIYGIEFGELEELGGVKITRKLEPYDKRVYIAVGSVFNTGQSYISYQQIYNAMRYEGRAGTSDLKKIHASLSKMLGAKIYVDNLEETTANYNYKHFVYDGSLLPMERVSALVGGQMAESVIHIFREPPLMTLARERRQITKVERKVLASPLSMTNANIQLEDYLIERISHMKNGKARLKMLFETIYKNAGITTTKQKQRAWAKIEKLLNHYVECGFISGYAKESDGVRIDL